MLNLTPHPITLRNAEGVNVTIQPSGTVARVAMVETATSEMLLGLPVIRREAGVVEGIPRDQHGRFVLCIVSSMVLDALPKGTVNVYAPDTGSTAIRDDKGHVVAVTRLVER